MGHESYLAYPLKFRPIFKEKIWGGQNLKTQLNLPIPPRKKIGESWEVAWLDNEISIISNGPYEGRSLSDLVEEFPEQVFGKDVVERFPDRFPLLFKLIDANEPISLQVHPSDEFAAGMQEGQWGKTEMWHILWAEPGAQVICGLKDWVNKDNLPTLLANGQGKECLEMFPGSAWDTVFIPAGRVHGTQGAVVFLEVQENSDVTYRLHDWNREGPGQKPRPLQLQKALEAIDFFDDEERIVNPVVSKKDEVEERLLITCDYFTVEKVTIPLYFQDECDEDKFMVYFIASGKGEISPLGMPEESMAFQKGDFLFLPASLGSFEVQTDTSCDIVKTIVT